MALRIHPLPLIALPRPPKSRLRPICFNERKSLVVSVSCAGKEIGDAEVASALAEEVARVHAQKRQKDEALSKSRALLFSELCGYLSLSEDELQKKWERMEDGERRDLAKEFVSNWSVHFHPLSARSVVEMVEEHLQQEKKPSFSNDSTFFPSLKRLMGLGESK
ncbi:uncharacterized protein LOC115726607 [Rhodamnia argentea]|uniref:Uncharacterized protein LOC115726607 n=1 Tax=Rhodamnia argentea TaxID=178133 RepID=A0A8B8MR85_9MYRT|nr:uncharacterized protein LOC115726607 [Rhodamnia argentea]XP_048128154.1 uncharacterized protein LOC115726607 [Rhodamnia argentea]